MTIEFCATIWYWKGPSPWFFVSVPAKDAADIKSVERLVTYGWGMVPAKARIGATEYETALWPKDGTYIVPIKASVRKAEDLIEGDTVPVHLTVECSERPPPQRT